MVVFGILVSLGLIAVSVALNFRMGFRSAETELDGKLYGAGAAFGDCLKAIAPFMMSWGVRNGDVLAAASSVVLFGICTSYSFVSSLGFAAEHRAGKAGAAQVELEAYGDLRAEKRRIENALAFHGAQRSVEEVEAAIAASLRERVWSGGQTVGAVSRGCSLDRKVTRAVCETVAKLKVELSAAREVRRLTDALEEVANRQASSGDTAVPTTADAQVDVLVGVAGLLTDAVGRDHVSLALSVLLACFIEVGSGVGLFMSTTPWRAKAATGRKETDSESGGKRRLGHVDAYMLARIEPGDGVLTIQEVHGEYGRWCLDTGAVAYSEAEFSKRFLMLAREAGIDVTTRAQILCFRDVRLVSRGLA